MALLHVVTMLAIGLLGQQQLHLHRTLQETKPVTAIFLRPVDV